MVIRTESKTTNRPATLAILIGAGVVVIGTLLTLYPVLNAGALTLDDPQYLTHNHLVQNPSWSSAWQFLREVRNPSTVGGYYQPLAMISLMLDYARGGRIDHLEPFHATALALHTANALLLFLLLVQLFGDVPVAGVVALLFGIHPLAVEPLAWIGERKTQLATFFALVSLVSYTNYAQRRTSWTFAVAHVAFIAGLLSKPTVVPLPVLLLLIDAALRRHASWTLIVEKLGFFACAAVFAVITLTSQQPTAAIAVTRHLSPFDYILIACHNLIFYPSKLLWPTNLALVHPFPEPIALSTPIYAVSLFGTIVLAAIALFTLRWTRIVAAGALFYAIALSPTLGNTSYSWGIAAEKYAYFPLIGVWLAIAGVLAAAIAQARPPSRRTATIVVIVLGGIAGVLAGAQTRKQLGYWRTDESLLRRAIAAAPATPQFRINLAVELERQGRTQAAIAQYDQIIRRFPKTMAMLRALNNIAWIRATSPDPAYRNAKQAVELAEFVCKATQYKQPDVLDTLAAAYADAGRYDEAVRTIDQALALPMGPLYLDLPKQLAERRALYEQHQPYRSPTTTTTTAQSSPTTQ